jgi:hypothetical protein
MRCSLGRRFPLGRAKSGRSRCVLAIPSVRPRPYLSRTHVPRADDTSTEQALAQRAGARCRGNGTRVRDAGRGNARPRAPRRAGSPAGPRACCEAGRPHRRTPAPPTANSSANPAPRRNGPPARARLPHAGTSPGTPADLAATGARSGRTGAPAGLAPSPGAPDFKASRAAAVWAARVRCGGRGARAAARGRAARRDDGRPVRAQARARNCALKEARGVSVAPVTG